MRIPHHKIYNRWIYLSDKEQGIRTHRARHKYHQQRRSMWPPDEKDTVTIEGTHIKTLNSLFCALGEAVNGPRGYFGCCSLYALHDCAWGGYGLKRGFHLIWKNHHISKQHLDNKMLVGYLNNQIKNKSYPDEDGLKYLLQHKKEAEDGYTMYQEIVDTLKHAEATVEEK